MGKSRLNPQRGRLKDWNQKLFFGILDLETENDRWKEENVRGYKVNQTSASKLFLDIWNPWSMVEKLFLGFFNEKTLINRLWNQKKWIEDSSNLRFVMKILSSDAP